MSDRISGIDIVEAIVNDPRALDKLYKVLKVKFSSDGSIRGPRGPPGPSGPPGLSGGK